MKSSMNYTFLLAIVGFIATTFAAEIIRRDVPTDNQKCLDTCPQDCGMTTDDKGCATCDCSENPFATHPPPSPRDEREATTKPPKGTNCRKMCQPDCGCTEDNDGIATCICTAENHPLIKQTPPKPSCNRALPLCKPPCMLEHPDDKICPVCTCPTE